MKKNNILLLVLSFISCNASYYSNEFKSAYNFNPPMPHFCTSFKPEVQQPSQSIGVNTQFGFGSYDPFHKEKAPTVAKAELSLIESLRELQLEGNKKSLQHRIENLKKDWLTPNRKERLRLAQEICADHITDLFDTIKNGTLEEATQALEKIDRLSPYKYRSGKGAVPHEDTYEAKAQHSLRKYGCDIKQRAQALYDKRSDTGFKEGIFISLRDDVPYLMDHSLTTPSKSIDVDALIDVAMSKRLSEISVAHRKALDDLADSIVLQCSTPEGLQNLQARIKESDREDIPYIVGRCIVGFTKGFSEPVLHPVKYAKSAAGGLYRGATFLCRLYFGQFYMSEAEQHAYLDSLVTQSAEAIEEIKKASSGDKGEMLGNLVGTVFADTLVFNGAKFAGGKAISVSKKILLPDTMVSVALGEKVSKIKISSSVKDVLMKDAIPSVENKSMTKLNFTRRGNYEKATEVFNSLGLENIRSVSTKKGTTIVGDLEGVGSVNLRNFCSADKKIPERTINATIEIISSSIKGEAIKIRFE